MTKKTESNKHSQPAFFKKLAGRKYFYPLLVFTFSFILYAATIFGNYNLDDDLVTRNHQLTSQGVRGIPEIFSSPYYSDEMGYSYGYRPVVLASFAIEHQIFGDNAHVSHFINVLLYALLCLIIFATLSRILPNARVFVLFVCLLFAAHPIHTEVVSSIKNREEILALLFSFLSLLVILYYKERLWLVGFAGGALLFILALLSKITVIAMAFAIPLTLVVFAQMPFRRILLLAVLLFVPALALSNLTLWLNNILVVFAALFALTTVRLIITRDLPFLKNLRFKRMRAVKKTEVIAQPVMQPVLPKRIVKTTRLSKLKKTAGYFIPPAAFLLAFYGLTFQNLWCTCAALLVLSAGAWYYKGIAWYWNAIIGFGIGLLLIELHDLNLNYISGAMNVLLLSLFLFGDRSRRKFWGVLYVIFFIYFWSHFQEGALDYLSLMLIVGIAYNKRLAKLGYIIFPLVLAGAVVYLISHLLSANSTPIEAPAIIAPIAAGILLSKAREKSIGWLQGLLLLVIGVALIAETNIPILEKTKVKTDLAYYLQGKRREVNNATDNATVALRREIKSTSKDLKETATNITRRVKQNVDKGAGNAVDFFKKTTNTVIEAETPKLTVTNQTRPLSFVESPVRFADPLSVRAATGLDVLLRYLKLVIIPYPQSFYYGYKIVEPVKLSSPTVVVSIVIHVLIIIGALFLLWQRKYMLFYAIVLYLLLIIPFINVWAVAGMMGDRFLFGASLGFCFLLVTILFVAFKESINSEPLHLQPVFKYSLVAILLLYSGLTFSRSLKWREDLVLMRNDIVHVEESAQAHNILARALMRHFGEETNIGKKQELGLEAVGHFKKALQIYPGFFNVAYDLGKAYTELNMPDSAIAIYRYALTIDTTFTNVQFNLADLLQAKGNYREAINYYNAAFNDNNKQYAIYGKLSFSYFSLKDYDRALQINRLALKNLTGTPEPLINIGRIYFGMGQQDSAVYYYEMAGRLFPNDNMVRQLLRPL